MLILVVHALIHLQDVGRINTTMAFFPEMKTALRTYHPVPSLQKTDGNAQDAPRIKNCLKAALLPSEFKSLPPSSPDEVLERRVSTLIEPHAKLQLTPTNLESRSPSSHKHCKLSFCVIQPRGSECFFASLFKFLTLFPASFYTSF